MAVLSRGGGVGECYSDDWTFQTSPDVRKKVENFIKVRLKLMGEIYNGIMVDVEAWIVNRIMSGLTSEQAKMGWHQHKFGMKAENQSEFACRWATIKQITSNYLASNGSLFQKGLLALLCDCLKLLMKRLVGKFDVVSLLTFNRWVRARTRDNSVEKRFSAVRISKPSSSSSSPELPESFGSCENNVERFVGLELLCVHMARENM